MEKLHVQGLGHLHKKKKIRVNLASHTFVAVFAFKTITANASVAFSCEAHLTDKVLSRAWFTVTNVLLERVLF